MQEHAAQAERAKGRVGFAVAVFLVARDRMSCKGRVHADLVGTPRLDRDVHARRKIAKMRDRIEDGHGDLAAAMHAHDALATLARMR